MLVSLTFYIDYAIKSCSIIFPIKLVGNKKQCQLDKRHRKSICEAVVCCVDALLDMVYSLGKMHGWLAYMHLLCD